jgi:hypothetical protein
VATAGHIYGTRRFSTLFTTAHNYYPSWSKQMPHHYALFKINFNIILQRIDYASKVTSGFRVLRLKFCTHISTRATCPTHPILLDFGITLSWDYKLWHLSLCSLLYPFVISFLEGPKMLPRILGCRTNTTNKQDRQCTCTVTLRGVRATIVTVGKQYYSYIFWLCACRLRNPACNAQAPYCHMWPVRDYYTGWA